MTTPILLITGFLGAGKTTLINRLLAEPQGRKLAAVVNDFGAIDIDATLLASVTDGVISLKNGCICCSLQGDLLRTLSTILRRSAPDGIVIETSGVSNPAEIVRALLDPVIFREAALDAVICVTDARMLTDQPELFDDTLWRSQLDAADYIALSKTDLVSQQECDLVRGRLGRHKPGRAIYHMVDGRIPPELLFSADLHRPAAGRAPKSMTALPAFQTISWTSRVPLIMARFQNVIGQLGPRLVRAKGIVEFAERPGQAMLFQLVGTRATISPAPQGVSGTDAVQLVFIARSGDLDEAALASSLERCRVSRM
jgi:G3E family GTPase